VEPIDSCLYRLIIRTHCGDFEERCKEFTTLKEEKASFDKDHFNNYVLIFLKKKT